MDVKMEELCSKDELEASIKAPGGISTVCRYKLCSGNKEDEEGHKDSQENYRR